jgi:hypothetical protein
MTQAILIQAFIGIAYLVLGLALGRYLLKGRGAEADSQPPLSRVLAQLHELLLTTTSKELAAQLESLADAKSRLTTTPRVDQQQWLSSAGFIMDGVIEVVQQVHDAVVTVGNRISQDLHCRDVAGLAQQNWFPPESDEISPATVQRRTKRFAFNRQQGIAPLFGDEMPGPNEFKLVQFRDISTGGFAFYSPDKLPSNRIVAQLGTPPDVVVVIAEVVHQGIQEVNGEWMFLVGCTIVERLKNKSASRQLATT